jgi:hypothetical protein
MGHKNGWVFPVHTRCSQRDVDGWPTLTSQDFTPTETEGAPPFAHFAKGGINYISPPGTPGRPCQDRNPTAKTNPKLRQPRLLPCRLQRIIPPKRTMRSGQSCNRPQPGIYPRHNPRPKTAKSSATKQQNAPKNTPEAHPEHHPKQLGMSKLQPKLNANTPTPPFSSTFGGCLGPRA